MMREIAALLVFYAAVKLTGNGGLWAVIGLLIGLPALLYFAASIAERFTKISSWFRISPGVPTPMDDFDDDKPPPSLV